MSEMRMRSSPRSLRGRLPWRNRAGRWTIGRGRRKRFAKAQAKHRTSSADLADGGGPGIYRELGLGLDREEAIVFREALGLRDRADLDLVAAPADGEVGEPVVLG